MITNKNQIIKDELQEYKIKAALKNANFLVCKYEIDNDVMYFNDDSSLALNIDKEINQFSKRLKNSILLDELNKEKIFNVINLIKNLRIKEINNIEIKFIINKNINWFDVYLDPSYDENNNIEIYVVLINVTKEKIMEDLLQEEFTKNKDDIKGKFLTSMRFNVTDNKIEDIQTTAFNNFYNLISYQEIYQLAINDVFISDKDRFEEIFRIDNLINNYNNDNKKYSFKYQRWINGRYIWVNSTVAMICRPSDNKIIAYLYTTDIHDNQIVHMLRSKIVLDEYDFLMAVNMKCDRAIISADVNSSGKFNTYIINDFKEKEIKFIRENIIKEDVERCLEYFDYEILEEKLNSCNEVTGVFSLIVNEKVYKKKYITTYLSKEMGILSIARTDVTEIFKEEEEQKNILNKAMLALEKSNIVKSEFLARMSHEIRTPMNAIIGLNNIAKERIDDKEFLLDCFDKTEVSAKYLLSLINDILDMTKIESGKMVLENKKFNIVKLINDINVIVSSQNNYKNIIYQCLYDQNVLNKHDYIGDEMRLKQVMINILSNAIKFTPSEGIVRFTVKQENIENNISYLSFVISDTGVGMSEEFLPKLFEPFTQESNNTTTKYTGSGLGLAIANNIINLLGGTINVTSKLGVGSTFIVKVPMTIFNGEEVTDYKIKNIDLSGNTVLLVDDHNLNIMVAEQLLKNVKLNVEIAKNGEEALNKFSNSKIGYYNLILMDIRMPIMDGYEATSRIRQLSREDNNVIIISMTANTFDEEIKKAYEVGMNDYLSKPIDPNIMYKKLLKYLKKNK